VIEANNRNSWPEIQYILKNQHGIDLSESTLVRRGRGDGIQGYVPYEKTLLNQEKAKLSL
jgi:hypothetical protein